MTLQASGAITMAQIDAEFGRGNNLNSYRSTAWYTDAGGSGTFSSGALAMSDFYSKRLTAPVSYSNPLVMAPSYEDGSTFEGSSSCFFEISQDGYWAIQADANGLMDNGTWIDPPQSTSGIGKYVKATLNSTSGSTSNTSWTTTTGWLQINVTRSFGVYAFSIGPARVRTANYTIQIATDSAGTNVVSTTTFSLSATAAL